MECTVDRLTQILSDALGVGVDVTERHAEALRDAGYLPKLERGDNCPQPVKVEHGVYVLLALMTGLPPAEAAGAVAKYIRLPLLGVQKISEDEDRNPVCFGVDPDDPLMWSLPPTLGVFLAFLAAGWGWTGDGGDFVPLEMELGGGPGTIAGSIIIAPTIHYSGPPIVGAVVYGTGATDRPDDAPKARLDHYGRVPGSIFRVLFDFFGKVGAAELRADLERAAAEVQT